ncbi:MAG: hypothetical protein ACI8WB_005393, partial [Phenylobacterium sp.]
MENKPVTCSCILQQQAYEIIDGYDEDEDYLSCQFEMPFNQLLFVDDQAYCSFHCPMTNKNNQPTVKGQWNEEEIEHFNDSIFELLNFDAKTKTLSGNEGDLRSIVFPGDIDFSDLRIEDVLSFNNCQFHGYIHFTNGTIVGDIEFSDAEFFDEANFFNTRFNSGITFLKTKFRGRLNMQASQKGSNEDFDERKLIKSINMAGAEFFDSIQFDNRIFTGSSVFTDCIFHKAPIFYGCELHQDTFFPPFKNFRDTSSPQSFQAYRVLKLSMENVRNRIDEGAFFALEQRSLRKSMTWYRRFMSFSFLYDSISVYGTNAGR